MAEPSGKTMIRIPSDLHAELKRRAVEQNVSFNSLVTSLLAGAVGFNLDKRK